MAILPAERRTSTEPSDRWARAGDDPDERQPAPDARAHPIRIGDLREPRRTAREQGLYEYGRKLAVVLDPAELMREEPAVTLVTDFLTARAVPHFQPKRDAEVVTVQRGHKRLLDWLLRHGAVRSLAGEWFARFAEALSSHPSLAGLRAFCWAGH